MNISLKALRSAQLENFGQIQSWRWGASLLLIASIWGCSSQEPSFHEETEVIKLRIDVGQTASDGTGTESSGDALSKKSDAELPNEAMTSEILDRLASNLPIDDLIASAESSSTSSTGPGGSSVPNQSTGSTTPPSASTDGTVLGGTGVEVLNPPNTTGSSTSPTPSTQSGGEGPIVIPGQNPPTPTPPSPPSKDEISKQDLRACAALQGVSEDKIMIVGHKGREVKLEQATSTSVIAYKLVGDRPRLVLDLVGGPTASLGGLCLFLTAHQSQAQVSLDVNVGRLVYIGRGDQSKGIVEVKTNRKLSSLAADLAGNKPSLRLFGEGDYPCSIVKTRGNNPEFICR